MILYNPKCMQNYGTEFVVCSVQYKIPADPLQSIAPKNRTRYNHIPRLTTLPRIGVYLGA